MRLQILDDDTLTLSAFAAVRCTFLMDADSATIGTEPISAFVMVPEETF